MNGQRETSTGEFRHIRAAQEAAKLVAPGNELQAAAAAEIMRLAIELEVCKAFPAGARPNTHNGPLESEIVDYVNCTYFGIKSQKPLPSDSGFIQPSVDQITEE